MEQITRKRVEVVEWIVLGIVLFMLMFAFGMSLAWAAPPCGGLLKADRAIRFTAEADLNAPITGFKLYRQIGTATPEMIDLGLIAPDATTGIRSMRLEFDNAKTYTVWVTAYGPGGESDSSNKHVVDAITSGPCDPPVAPRLIEIVILTDGVETDRVRVSP